MPFHRPTRLPSVLSVAILTAAFGLLLPIHLGAQDPDNPTPEKHGRKYKAPPETSHIEVTVIKGFNKKPIDGAHVVFHPVKDGIDEGNLEVKTHPDGKVSIDVIPTGSSVRIQVLADGFATYAQDYVVNEPSREILIPMQRPREQISAYVDNEGKPAQVTPGVQVPIRPKKTAPPPAGSGQTATPNSSPNSTTSGSDSGSSKPQS
jgi:hypothetical protein